MKNHAKYLALAVTLAIHGADLLFLGPAGGGVLRA